MNKPLKMINDSTGEVIDDWHIQLVDPHIDSSCVKMRALVNGKIIWPKDIGYWEVNDTDPVEVEDDSTESYFLESRLIFGKVFKLMPKFESNNIHYRYWCAVERSIQHNTGVIQFKYQGKWKDVQILADWICLLDGKRSSVSTFVRDCMKSGYLGFFESKERRIYFANPDYVWNGARIPKHVHDFFRRTVQIKGTRNPKVKLPVSVSTA